MRFCHCDRLRCNTSRIWPLRGQSSLVEGCAPKPHSCATCSRGSYSYPGPRREPSAPRAHNSAVKVKDEEGALPPMPHSSLRLLHTIFAFHVECTTSCYQNRATSTFCYNTLVTWYFCYRLSLLHNITLHICFVTSYVCYDTVLLRRINIGK